MQKNGSHILRHENDKVYSTGFAAEASTAKGNIWSANSGVEVYNDLVKSKRTDTDLTSSTSTAKRGLYPDGSTMTGIALFTVHRFGFPKWNISAGARLNSFVIQVSDEDIGMTTLTPSALVGNLALMRKLGQSSNVFVSVNSGFRAPNIDDQIHQSSFQVQTPILVANIPFNIGGYKYQGQSFG
jgi:outer membrane receptor protein involved in Fe transport